MAKNVGALIVIAGLGLGALLFASGGKASGNGGNSNTDRYRDCLDPNMPPEIKQEFANTLAIWFTGDQSDDAREAMQNMIRIFEQRGYPMAAACARDALAGKEV